VKQRVVPWAIIARGAAASCTVTTSVSSGRPVGADPWRSLVKIHFRRVERVGSLSVVDATSVWPFLCDWNSCSNCAANLSKIRNSYKGNHWRTSARLRRFTTVVEVSASCRQRASGGSAMFRAEIASCVPR
jgi:hypothetical protein